MAVTPGIPTRVNYANGKYYLDYNLAGGAILHYYPEFLTREEADFYYETFELLPFQQGQVKGGNENRLSRFFGGARLADGSLKPYYYSGKENVPLEFNDEMRELAAHITRETGHAFNSCLVNYYASGKNTIGLHSDSETSLQKGSAIGSVSLGAERYFDVVAKDSAPPAVANMEKIRITMRHGSMIVMAGTMQQYYKHAVPSQAAVKTPRINLTFRLSK